MARTLSTMLELGTAAPDFTLLDPSAGEMISLADFSTKPIMIVFMCNHCPYVKQLGSALAAFADEYQAKGMAVVAINSNDVDNYPDDSPEKMIDEVKINGYHFPYLYDATQAVARAYKAACTPDFFLFDHEHKLVYRGQFDDARPGNDEPVTGKDLRAAATAVLARQDISAEQVPSMGCNIKWKPGNEPEY
ncbi:MAG: thioredoxin family protein [Gammaproteobacteria bacterium]|nr:thioredoxin family protein [Gammaproteobacteria bacterium]